MIVGNHNIADYQFFTILREGVRSLVHVNEATFLSYESFSGMVASTHESFHVFQSLVNGTCCAVADVEDTFVAAFRQAMRSGKEADLSVATGLSADCKH